MIIKKLRRSFYKMENDVNNALSKYPVLYALIAGIGVVLFWRGVWHTADDAGITSTGSLVIGGIILLVTGIFISEFIGKKIIISDLVGDIKLAEKEEGEIETEETQIKRLQSTLNRVEAKLAELEQKLEKK